MNKKGKLNRLINVIYLLLHIPLLGIGYYAITETSTYLNVKNYQVRCFDGSLVILQGGSKPYKFELDQRETLSVIEDNNFRFYCQYGEAIAEHNERYFSSSNEKEEIEANLAFNEFRESAPVTSSKNYNLEAVPFDDNYYAYSMISAISSVFVYYLLLQFIRVIYQYVMTGVFSIHPYKNIE